MKIILDLYGFRKEIECERPLERTVIFRVFIPPQTAPPDGVTELAFKDLQFIHDKRGGEGTPLYKYQSGL